MPESARKARPGGMSVGHVPGVDVGQPVVVPVGEAQHQAVLDLGGETIGEQAAVAAQHHPQPGARPFPNQPAQRGRQGAARLDRDRRR